MTYISFRLDRKTSSRNEVSVCCRNYD